MSAIPTSNARSGRRHVLRVSADGGLRAPPFEYLLFALALAGMATGGVAIALGLLQAPTTGMVVGDWYLLTSGFIIVAAAGSDRRAIFLSAALVAVLSVAFFLPVRLLAPGIEPKAYVKGAVALAAAASVLMQFSTALRRGAPLRDNRDMAVACFAVALVVTPLVSGWGIQISALIPQTFDANALRMDEAFGLRVPAWLDEAVQGSRFVSYVVFHVYISISLAMVGYDLLFDETREWRMTKLMLVSSLLGFVAYFITPVVGTGYFRDYGQTGALRDLLAHASAGAGVLPRNAMPSLHTTWGLMLIVSATLPARRVLWQRAAAALFVVYGVLTICGALTFGDHYLIDCVVAAPLTATIMLAFEGAETRAKPGFAACFSTGAALLAGWIVMLRTGGGLLEPPVVLAMAAASLAQMAATIALMRSARAAHGWT